MRRVCDCTGEWSMENFIEIEIEKIRAQVGDRKVLCAMSGGVDSSVVAVLLPFTSTITNATHKVT